MKRKVFMETLRGDCKGFLTAALIFIPKFVLVASWLPGHDTELKRKRLGSCLHTSHWQSEQGPSEP